MGNYIQKLRKESALKRESVINKLSLSNDLRGVAHEIVDDIIDAAKFEIAANLYEDGMRAIARAEGCEKE